MIKCPSCSIEIDERSCFCSSCGAALQSSPVQPTVTAPPKAVRRAAQPAPSGSSSDAIDQARFTPGTMLTERYRIVGLLGKGGMGEVYRADDLKLRQPVALKFLPPELANDPRRLERFHNEVRVARQVSHPNVCRVYDIGEVDGEHFISMEYVDGEDLASLIRRIGRLPRDKATQIGRQLCAGLAAAHERGVLHRDLKPHNVMIDGRGKVRITDFGLAGFAADFAEDGKDVAAGTPAYTAPEQLAGKEVTTRSDIYSLGLVLYHMFTGRPAFKANTRQELRRLHNEALVTTPASIVDDLDPAVERVIMRCLEGDPRERPSSALAVSAALPGGDPLAAALAAGETPSPDMVAAAGEKGVLRPVVALMLLI
ncbi:MAG: protein kinase, partial [Phycisphaerales bacterium]